MFWICAYADGKALKEGEEPRPADRERKLHFIKAAHCGIPSAKHADTA